MSVVLLYIASVVPTLKLTLCAVSSALVCVVMIKYGAKGSFAVYMACSLVAFVVAADKTVAAGYFLFFGNYPIIKAFIEKKGNMVAEWIVKILVFAVYAFGAYAVAMIFFPSMLTFKYSLGFTFAAVIAVAAVYDVALSMIISEITRRFSNLLR